MKTFWLILIVFLLGFGTANAAILKWNASVGDVAGYNVHYGEQAGLYSEHVDVGNVTSVSDMQAELNLHFNVKYYFVVRSYNAAGESGDSNEVDYTVPSYTPPPDKTPSAVIHIPGPVTIIVE